MLKATKRKNKTVVTSSEGLVALLNALRSRGVDPTQVHVVMEPTFRAHMSKAGPVHLRKLHYMSAIVAVIYDLHIWVLYLRLLERGKPKTALLERPCASLPICASASFILANRIAPLSA
jgi:hypothetical protein